MNRVQKRPAKRSSFWDPAGAALAFAGAGGGGGREAGRGVGGGGGSFVTYVGRIGKAYIQPPMSMQ